MKENNFKDKLSFSVYYQNRHIHLKDSDTVTNLIKPGVFTNQIINVQVRVTAQMQESFLVRDKLLAIEFMFHKYQSDLVHDKGLLKVENKQGFLSWGNGHKNYRNLTIGELIKEELDLFSNNYATAV